MFELLVSLLPLALLGAVFGLDMVSFPQIMIARPIVSATIAGTVAGSPADGLLAGVILELIALETLPFGASRYPEWGSAGAVGGFVMALQPTETGAQLPIAILAALSTAFVSSWSMVAMRRLNVRTVRALQTQTDAGSASAVLKIQLKCMTNDFIRGGLVTLLGLIVFVPLARVITPLWSSDINHSRAIVIATAGTVALGAVWKLFHTVSRSVWYFLSGLAIGTAILVGR